MVQDITNQEVEKRMDDLARKYADFYSDELRAELEELSREIAEMKNG